jgi:inner membrane protein
LIFFLNPISIAITLIGASLPDFDHDIKKSYVYKLLIIGLLIFIVLYILNLPYLFGIILCIFPVIFYFSNHRGFTHSLLGIIILSALMFVLIIMGISAISPILTSLNLPTTFFSSNIISMVLIVLFLAMLVINNRLKIPFLILFLLGVVFLPNGLITNNSLFDISHITQTILTGDSLINNYSLICDYIGYNEYIAYGRYLFQYTVYIFLPLFLGFLSHLILDSLTPAGIELFRPFSSKKVYKKFAIVSLLILSVLAILKYFL